MQWLTEIHAIYHMTDATVKKYLMQSKEINCHFSLVYGDQSIPCKDCRIICMAMSFRWDIRVPLLIL